MKRILAIITSTLCLSLYAVEYTPLTPPMGSPSNTMQSVNNGAYMSSGSAYSTTVYEVGSYSPSAQAPAVTPRRGGLPGKDDTNYDPNNPQFAPLPDALLPLLLFALGYGLFFLPKKSRQTTKKKI